MEKIKSKMARISPMEDAENFTSQILDTKKHRDLAKKNGIWAAKMTNFTKKNTGIAIGWCFPGK